jgi:predicted DsbA family dithiol-disulfide isomerase
MREEMETIEMVLHHDVLCGWSWLADKRLRALSDEFGGMLRIDYRPYPLRIEEMVPTDKEREAEIKALRKVGREKDGKGIVADLWRSSDPPRSSVPPLLAVEAARIIGGVGGRDRMLYAMRRAALQVGLNVSRDDVLVELAEQCGLDVGRFTTALHNSGTKRLVMGPWEQASQRGIEATPAVLVGGEWLLTGTRTVAEYRETIERYIEKRCLYVPSRVVH